MARVQSLFRISGKLGGLVFYQTKKGSFVREAPRCNKQRWLEAPEFAAQRARAAEFGQVSKVASQWTRAIKDMMDGCVPRDLYMQVRKLCQQLICLDPGPQGDRSIFMGLFHQDLATLLLQQWPCQTGHLLPDAILNKTLIQASNLCIHIPQIDLDTLWNRPLEATTYQIRAHWAFVLPDSDEMVVLSASSPIRKLNCESHKPVCLEPGKSICSELMVILFLEIRYYQPTKGHVAMERSSITSQLEVLRVLPILPEEQSRSTGGSNPDFYHPN